MERLPLAGGESKFRIGKPRNRLGRRAGVGRLDETEAGKLCNGFVELAFGEPGSCRQVGPTGLRFGDQGVVYGDGVRADAE